MTSGITARPRIGSVFLFSGVSCSGDCAGLGSRALCPVCQGSVRRAELRAKVGDGQAADEISVSRPSAKITPVSILGKRCFASIARQRF